MDEFKLNILRANKNEMENYFKRILKSFTESRHNNIIEWLVEEKPFYLKSIGRIYNLKKDKEIAEYEDEYGEKIEAFIYAEDKKTGTLAVYAGSFAIIGKNIKDELYEIILD